jgi:fatty-acyl-CoA synthase
MFHCNGWCFPWTVAARAGVNVCLRKFEPKLVFDLMRDMASPTTAPRPSCMRRWPTRPPTGARHRWTVRGMVAGAPPPAAMLAKMEAMGFDLTHSMA